MMRLTQREKKRKQTRSHILTGTNDALKGMKGDSESLSHKLMKFWIWNYCMEKGLQMSTEVSFLNHERADVIVKDWGVAIEVLTTEKISDFLKKDYPIPTIPVPFYESLGAVWKMLEELNNTDGGAADFYRRFYVDYLRGSKRRYHKITKKMWEIVFKEGDKEVEKND
jgi:hypothetical protein